MRVTVKNHALPVYKKNRIASFLCIFETIIILIHNVQLLNIDWKSQLLHTSSMYSNWILIQSLQLTEHPFKL